MIWYLTVNFPSSRTQECRASDSLKCCKKWCVVGVEGRKGWAAGTADKISFKWGFIIYCRATMQHGRERERETHSKSRERGIHDQIDMGGKHLDSTSYGNGLSLRESKVAQLVYDIYIHRGLVETWSPTLLWNQKTYLCFMLEHSLINVSCWYWCQNEICYSCHLC